MQMNIAYVTLHLHQISAIFILNKLKNSSEFKDLKDIPEE